MESYLRVTRQKKFPNGLGKNQESKSYNRRQNRDARTALGWKGGLLGGVLGYLLGLFFKSAIIVAITFKAPSFSQYLTNTFVPSSDVDFIRFFTVPVPFALLGAALGLLVYRSKTQAGGPNEPEAASLTTSK